MTTYVREGCGGCEECDLCGGTVDPKDRVAEDRWAIAQMTEALERNPDLAKKLWVVLKLAAGETR